MWHPSFTEDPSDSAGLFVHFRRRFILVDDAPGSLMIQVTADTRYKLYVNGRLISFGPVKGDQNLWFYDEIDVAPYLKQGSNEIGVHVLRFFYATPYAPSFPRLPSGGLRVVVSGGPGHWVDTLSSSTLWETAIDTSARLRTDEPEDCFLHVYEAHADGQKHQLLWVAAKLLEYKNSTGNAPPWNLAPSRDTGVKTNPRPFHSYPQIAKLCWHRAVGKRTTQPRRTLGSQR